MSEFSVDVVIVGAGVQGLWALHYARERGLSAVVFAREMEGESLHGHELVGTGYLVNTNPEMSAIARGRARQQLDQLLAREGKTTVTRQLVMSGGPSGMFSSETLTDRWTKDGLPFRQVPDADVPALLRGGSMVAAGATLFEIGDYCNDWRDPLIALCNESKGLVKQGTLTEIRLAADGASIDHVVVDVPQIGSVTVRAKAVVLATGAWTAPLVGATVTSPDAAHRAAVVDRMRGLQRVYPIPMFCVRGPESVLPVLGAWDAGMGMSLAFGSGYIAGSEPGSRDVCWYASPMPLDGVQAVEPDSGFRPEDEFTTNRNETINKAAERLFKAAPGLTAIRDQLRFGFYCGWKVGGPPTTPVVPPNFYATDLGLRNLQLLWPVVWINAIPCAEKAIESIISQVPTPSPAPDLSRLPGLPTGAKFAESIKFSSWDDFRAEHGLAAKL
eukprot:TRINITY_DN18857_c0_g1_i1.p1 TRINITY_DN18857_c0_g1~~TRINITY_DN18857_c0_g1_i1.p1  ORF type:complete len:443 (+),score=133.08 TRINITY_DN18857_c0_g1_i1:152-1480(+)